MGYLSTPSSIGFHIFEILPKTHVLIEKFGVNKEENSLTLEKIYLP